MRISIGLILLATAIQPAAAFGQQPPTAQPIDEPSSTVVIDTPPPPRAGVPEFQTPSTGVILDRPGRVLISGKPVRAHFSSPTDGVAFQLQVGGSYSSISGVSFGMSYGWGGPGWGGYGIGYGAAPYYGEIVTKAYQPICETPCDATLLSGRHRMALSLDGGKPVNVTLPVDLTEDSTVEGRYIDKRRLRKAGWATFVAGSLAGMALMFASIDYRNDPLLGDQIRYRPMFYTGISLFVGSIITGAVLASQDDEARVTVFPVQ
ncbi:MAG: hypothetical protein JRG93_16335 [Deltaproteobacteria bacterium]|nr:hypothetical protein [Deltaproteobacteria bacterium]MBW2405092.1 hypothetical protein [Deltaproteobacteria bacterium]